MRFVKQILKPGVYLASTPSGRKRRVRLTLDRLKRICETFQNMLKAGLNIPAPWGHDGSIPVRSADVVKNNVGFWKKLWLDQKTGWLYGELEVPREEDASRVGTTVQEVSPFLAPEWRDGQGNVWKDAILHIGLVAHPVVAGQENFQKAEESAMSLQMSGYLFADEGTELERALAILRGLGLPLPDDTTEENLLERILIAGEALLKKKQDEEGEPEKETGEQKSPEKPQQEPAPVAMAAELEAAGQKIKVLEATASKLLGERYLSRIRQLVATGRCSPDYANKKLVPMAENLQFSLDEKGVPMSNPLDPILEALEAQPANPITRTEEPFPYKPTGELTDEEAEKIADSVFQVAGLKC